MTEFIEGPGVKHLMNINCMWPWIGRVREESLQALGCNIIMSNLFELGAITAVIKSPGVPFQGMDGSFHFII